MKLRINAKLRAALIAAVSVVGYTLTTAQAADVTLSNVMNTGGNMAVNTDVWGDTGVISSASASYTITAGSGNPASTGYTNSFLATRTNVGSGTPGGSYTYTLTFRTAESLANPVTLSSINVDFITYNGNGVGHPQEDGAADGPNRITCVWTLTDTEGGTLSDFSLHSNGHANQNTAAYTKSGETYTTNSFTGGTATLDFNDITLESNKEYTLTLAVSKKGGANGFFVGIGNVALINTPEVKISTWNGTEGHSTWSDADAWSGTPFADGGAAVFDGNAAVKTATVTADVTAESVTVGGAAHEFALAGGNLTTGTLTVSGDGSLTITGEGTVAAGTLAAEGKTISIGSGVVLTGAGNATLAGAGTYALASGTASLGNVKLGDNWTGTVSLTAVDANNLNFDNLTKGANSTLELRGYKGYSTKWYNEQTNVQNIHLVDDESRGYAWKMNAWGSSMPTVGIYSGTWTGDGTLSYETYSGNDAKNVNQKFTGDLSAWTGTLKLDRNGTLQLTVALSNPHWGAAIDRNQGVINMIVEKSTEFAKSVSVTSLNVAAGNTVTFDAATNIANGVTLGTGATLVNEDTLTLGGAVVFGGNAITNNGTVAFGNNLVFNLNGLTPAEEEGGVHTYTLFSGNDVDMRSLGLTNISIDGGTAGKVWNFETPGKISWTLASSVAWNGGSEGVWDYETANWGEPAAAFTRGSGADFNTSASVTVADAIEADAVVVASGATVNLIAGEGTLQAQGLTVNGTLTTGLAVNGLSSYTVAEGATWNINANQTLGAGTNSGTINVGEGARVTVTANALAVVNGMTNSGTVALTLSGDTRLEMNAASNGTVELTGGTLDYRSELGTQTIKLNGTRLLFGTRKGDVIDTVFTHDIELGGNSTIQVYGTSQHKSVTIDGTITGDYELTKSDGNQTTTFAGKLTVKKFSTAADSTGKTVIAAGAEISNNLAPTKGTMELHGDVTIGNDLDLSIGNTSEATVLIASDGNVSSKNMWMRSVAHIDLQKDGQLTLRDAGLNLVGLEGGGSVTTTAGNVSYGANRNDFTISGAAVTATKDVTLGNKLTNSTLATGQHTVTLSNTGNTLAGLSIANGGTLTLSGDSVINGITALEVGSGATLNLGSGKQGSLSSLIINDGGRVISSRGGQASGFLANDGTIVVNGGGVLKLTGGNDALGWGGGHVVSVTLQGTEGHVAKLDMTEQSGSETMAANLILNGYAEITDSSNQHGFNTYGGTITATGTQNQIARIEVRSDVTFNVTGETDTLDVGIMTLSSQQATKLATKTGAGTLTFTGGAATQKLTLSEGTVVLGGDSTLAALEIAAAGTLQIDGGTTIVSGDSNVISNTIALGADGHLTMTGNYDISAMSPTSTPTYENGGSPDIAVGNGFMKHDGTIQVVAIAEGEAGRLNTEGATFAFGSDSGSLNADGTFSMNGEVDYTKLYVNNNNGVSFAAAWEIAQGQVPAVEIASVVTAANTTLTADLDGASFALTMLGDTTVNATQATTITAIEGWSNNTLSITGTGAVSLLPGQVPTKQLTGTTALNIDTTVTTAKLYLYESGTRLTVGEHGVLNITASTGNNNNLTLRHGTAEVSGTVNVGHEIDLSDGGAGVGATGTLHILGTGSVTAGVGLWMNHTAGGILLDENAKFAITGKSVKFTGKASGGSIKAASGQEINYQASNDNALVENVVMEATGNITIANRLTNVDVITGANTVTLNSAPSAITVSTGGTLVVNVDLNIAGNLQSSGAITVNAGKSLTLTEGSSLFQTVTNSGTVSLTGITLGGGFQEQQEGSAYYDIDGNVTTEDQNHYDGSATTYVQVVNGGASTGTDIRWNDESYALNDAGRIIVGQGGADYSTFFVKGGTVELSKLNEGTSNVKVEGGTLVVDNPAAGITIEVTDGGTITGEAVTPEDVKIANWASAEFTKDVQGVGYEFKTGDAQQGELGTVTITNFGEDAAYSAENPLMMVSTQTLEMTDHENDATVTNMVMVNEVVNETGHKLTLENAASVNLKSMTIGQGSTVEALYTDAQDAQVEGTVTITESLTAGGGKLYANLTLEGHEGEQLLYWDLNGAGENALTLGSVLTLDTQSGLIQLDNETMQAIAALGDRGEYLELVLNGGEPGTLGYDGDAWFDGVFSRTYTNAGGELTQLGGDYNVQLLENGNFGIVKFSDVPEPTTGTLSLLALAALAARRRKH